MNLYFLRHAESVANTKLKDQFARGDQLSPHGRKQAEAVVSTLVQNVYHKIFVSPSVRALQTIAPYLIHTKRIATILPACAEIPSRPKILKNIFSRDKRPKAFKIPEVYQDLFAPDPRFTAVPMRAESLIDVNERLTLFERYIVGTYGSTATSLLLVSHGRFGRELIQRLLGRKVSHPENAQLWKITGSMCPFALDS